MRALSPTLLAFSLLAVVLPARAATPGADNAGNYATTGWATGTNGGTGFGAWDLTGNNNNGSTLFAGYFLGDSTAGSGNINSTANNSSFAMYANPNGAFADASRAFAGGALTAGQTFSLQLAVNFRNGDKGLNLYDGGGQVFNFDVGQSGTGADGYYYTANGGAAVATGFAYYSDSVFFLSFQQQTATGGLFTIARTSASGGAAAANSVSVPVTTSGATSFTLYNSNTQNGDNANNLYFNNLAVVPEPSVCILAALGATGVAVLRRRR